MDIQFPPFLQKGDKVVIVSPSSKIDQQFLKGAKKRMESWGLKVAIGKHAGSSSGRYAGTIKQRLKDLQDAMDDPKVKAILCSRGGYGADVYKRQVSVSGAGPFGEESAFFVGIDEPFLHFFIHRRIHQIQ